MDASELNALMTYRLPSPKNQSQYKARSYAPSKTGKIDPITAKIVSSLLPLGLQL